MEKILRAMKIFGSEADGKRQVEEVLDNLPKTDTGTVQHNAINTVLYVAGLLAVVMIIVSGIQMTTSAGDSGKVAKAKQTMTYSIVGLAIVLLAYAIVNFVVGQL